MRFGPTFVLRLQDAAGHVAQADQSGQALAGMCAARSQCCPTVDNRNGLAADVQIGLQQGARDRDDPIQMRLSESEFKGLTITKP